MMHLISTIKCCTKNMHSYNSLSVFGSTFGPF